MGLSTTKRIPKSRKDHKCDYCGKAIPKGTVYYRHKMIYPADNYFDTKFGSVEIKQCPKCLYSKKEHRRRYANFVQGCEHPRKFRGSDLDGQFCMLCRSRI